MHRFKNVAIQLIALSLSLYQLWIKDAIVIWFDVMALSPPIWTKEWFDLE